ncbi:Geraniol 8-hydroxylase [Platanthera guangdongensis]|uniref:Geraniol 8-hydroxylase n=1 Tax=Platanthera guangdongensis TaxID=2320717 RepID=A0ABR2MKJ6_9ASPA
MELSQGAILWTALLALIVVLVLLLLQKSLHPSNLPPGPRHVPVLGNLFVLGKNPHRSLARLARIHGPVMSLKLGSIHAVVISSPSSAREALKSKDIPFSDRHVPDTVRAHGHNEVSLAWTSPNKSWRYLRTLLKTHLFSSPALDASQSLRRRKVQELVTYIKELDGEAVKIGQAAFCTVLNLISSTFLSINVVDFKSESAQEFKELICGIMEEAGRPNVSDFFPLLAPMDLQGRRRRFAAYFQKLFDLFDQIMDIRLEETAVGEAARKNNNPDILDVLLQLSREDSSNLSRQKIKSFIMDSFAAGSDTSSTTLEWAMAELLHQPKLMKKARAEISQVIGFEREVEESDISKLPFLQAVLKETLRLHPPLPLLLPHKTGSDTELNGYTVPENTMVIFNVWAIGRDDRVWKNPDCFVPERFMGLDEDVDFRGQHFELIPFGSGRRICPGLSLGVRMVQLMLASLIQSFEWRLPDDMAPEALDLREMFGLTVVMASPLVAIATSNTV